MRRINPAQSGFKSALITVACSVCHTNYLINPYLYGKVRCPPCAQRNSDSQLVLSRTHHHDAQRLFSQRISRRKSNSRRQRLT